MTIPEFNKKLGDSVTKIDNSLGEIMVELGSDALATITKRVQEEGKDAKGQEFKPYSKDPMLVGCKTFKKKNCNSFFGKRKNKEHRWATIKRGSEMYHLAYLEGGYRELREMELGAGHGDKVDFSYKNDMWNDMGIISNASEHNSGYVTIGPREELQMKKLKGNVDRRGQILDLSDAEIRELNDRFGKKIINIIG